jgi:NAD(P)-dependent dehydrogenase (short-subunit alcohol dehydrogenase family)
MARDLGRFGIRVVTIAPYVFDIPIISVIPEPAKNYLLK